MTNMISFPNIFNKSSGKTMLVSNNTEIKQAIKCVLLTNIGELLGDPMFGSNIKSSLFEIKNDIFITILKQRIVDAITKHVKSAKVNGNEIEIISYPNNSKVKVVINYYNVIAGETDFIELVALENGEFTTK